MKNNQLATSIQSDQPPGAGALTVQQVLGQVALIQEIMNAAMIKDQHYGRIPGCGDKPTLLKPGAEKLCLTFRLAPTYDVEERLLPNDHREYRVTCSLTSILSGVLQGQGVGICSSMEAKYRYRGNTAELTDKIVPRAYWDIRQEDPVKAQEMLGGKGFTPKKENGQWFVAKAGEKAEHDNIADVFNTVLKMSKKRALVDAVLTATAASDIFAQDLEDLRDNLAAANSGPAREVESEPVAQTARQPAPVAKHPASKPIQGDDVERWDCQVHSVEEKKGTSKAGKPYTRYTVNLNTQQGSKQVSTIEEYVADKAYALKDSAEDIIAVVEKGQYGYKLLSFDPLG